MTKNIVAGIDIGTQWVKVIVADDSKNYGAFPNVLGVGYAKSAGLRKGYIDNRQEAAASISKAINKAEKSSGMKIKKAYLAIGGIGLEEFHSSGEVVISRADSRIVDLDLEKARKDCEKKINKKLKNKRILHSIPLAYHIDGELVLGQPHGLQATKLEVHMLFITCLEQHFNEFVSAVEEAGVEVEDIMAAPIAASLASLNKNQKKAGCVMLNVGSESSCITIFENDLPISLKCFSIGSNDITKDIALGFKIPIDEAEQVKLGALTDTNIPKKRLDEIVNARLSDIFELVEKHLEQIGKSQLLPAGVITIGGGSHLSSVEDIGRNTLNLPSKATPLNAPEKSKVNDNTWAVAYGLCIWGLTTQKEHSGIKIAKKTGGSIVSWLKQFLP